jgi:LuxR family transcriptional regulator, maltose regulon positive regulatory protein
MKARIWIAQGRLTKALEWVREQGLSSEDAPSYLRESEHVTLARVLIAWYKSDQATGSIHEAISLLEHLLHAAVEGVRMGSVIEILALLALAHAAQGNITPALVQLERALTLGESEGYVRIFVDEGEPMRLLISDFRLRIEKRSGHAVVEDIKGLKAYTAQLLEAFSKPPDARAQKSTTPALAAGASVQNLQSKILPEPLSERELEVLRLLRTEMSGPEIARELIVSLNTFRTHTKNIFNKLGVNNRRVAVCRAEELDLF